MKPSVSFASRIGSALERTRDALEHSGWVLLVVLIGAFAMLSMRAALSKPFWNDEIFTLVLAKLPSVSEIWRAERSGLDLSPPLNSVLTHFVLRAAPVGPITARLVPIVSVCGMLVAIFVFVHRRSNALTALASVMAPVFTGALPYSYEARAYGLMLGCFALGLLAWAEAAAGRGRRGWLITLAVVVAASGWNHYYGLMLIASIAAGEGVRCLDRRRVDWPVCASVATGLASLVPLRSISGMAFGATPAYWPGTFLESLRQAYSLVLGFLVAKRFLVLYAIVALVVGWGLARRLVGDRRLPRHELAALLVAVLIPLWAGLAGLGLTHVFLPRYCLAAVVGVSMLGPLLIWRFGPANGLAEVVLCLGLMVNTAALCAASFRERVVTPNPVQGHPRLVADLRGRDPVVVTGHLFLETWFYADNELRHHLVYLADRDLARQIDGGDWIDFAYLSMARWLPIDVRPYRGFVATTSSFRLYATPRFRWLVEALERDGASLEPRGMEDDVAIYDVRPRAGHD